MVFQAADAKENHWFQKRTTQVVSQRIWDQMGELYVY
jgi:hypothetical protein